ncbi:MAG TPA: type 4a pilus biogenesis protein PilO [Vicinamibacterales bacterium]|nr:type 4a pilus biogenesis protein PilO [Vicinamibacterales bacterium]
MTVARVVREKRHLIWPLALVLIANAAVWLLVVYPLSQKVAVGEQESETAAAVLEAARRDYANARATVTGKTQADAELAKFYSEVLPPDLSGARRITFLPLDQLAAQSNLRVERLNTERSTVRDSQLRKLSQVAVLTGEYRDIRRFIHRLETAPEFIILENVTLAQSEQDTSRGITVTVQVATYYRAGGDGN